MLTRPSSSSNMPGRVRDTTPAVAQACATLLITGPGAVGMAMITSWTPCVVIIVGSVCRSPRTRTPRIRLPRFTRSSSSRPTGRNPSPGFRWISRSTAAPAAPAPTTRRLRRGPDFDPIRTMCRSFSNRRPKRNPPTATSVSSQSMSTTDRENSWIVRVVIPIPISRAITPDAALTPMTTTTRSLAVAYSQ